MIKDKKVRRWLEEGVNKIIDGVERSGALDKGDERLLRLKLPMLDDYKAGELDEKISRIKQTAGFFRQHAQYVLEEDDDE